MHEITDGTALAATGHTLAEGSDVCTVCGADTAPDNNGLSAGAIVGIVLGSVALLGGGGFAIFWFVIKKKSFADLIAVFKKK